MAGSRSRSSAHSSPLDLSRFDYTTQTGRMAALVEVFKVVRAYQYGELSQLPDFVGMPAALGALVRRLCDSTREMRETLAARLRANEAAEVEAPDSPAEAGCEVPPVRFERAGTGTVIDSASELQIRLRPDYVQYCGTRAALEAEGLIPPCTEWPKGRYGFNQWTRGQFDFRLRVCRPEGFKGRVKDWSAVDYWALNCSRSGEDFASSQVVAKRKELEKATYRASPEGRVEAETQRNRYWRAQGDEPFQALKTRLLAGTKKPGRKATQPRTQEGGVA